ncbi:amino acid transporter AVT1D-like [Pistacia vera]|uniref:amino acid transporter AVT1D-like n=1 Tax=Pistacia vera TaxID=55513 RepID=UPI001262B5F3|nr:amino acid transporter AVT1D-like [Pistacia vera]
MKLMDEDLGTERADEFATDDEENQAERVCEINDDSESDYSGHSMASDNATDNGHTIWPQSYRDSVDMYTSIVSPSFGFLRGTSLTRLGSSMRLPSKRNLASDFDSLPTKPLISDLEKVVPEKLSSRKLSLNDYDLPPQKKQSSFAQAVLNGINVLCGVGLLAAPFAVKEGGWLSLSLILLFAVIACDTGILLQKCLDSSPGLRTYPDIGQAAFGKPGRQMIAIILYMELYAACVEYTIMMGDNLSSLFPNTNMYIAGMHLNSNQLFAITSTLIILPTVWLRNLSLLAYISVGGVLITGLVMLCLVWIGVVDNVGFHRSGTALDLANLPVSVGIYGFCYAGHSVFPNIYSSMKEPSQFPWVLIISFFFGWVLNTGIAVCGYLMFGDSVKSQFTLNMPKQLVASKVSLWTTVVIPMTKYALTLTPVALSLEELIPSAQLQTYSVSIVIRTILVISTLVVALTVPFFASLMSLVGSFLTMLVTLIFPCVCYLSILKGRLSKLKIAVCLFYITIGVVCAYAGTYSALTRIANQTNE